MDVLLVGSGEYVTGLSDGGQPSDKRAGVAALTFFHLRSRGLGINRILIAGTRGTRFPAVRAHFEEVISRRYSDLAGKTSFESFPGDDVASDPLAYVAAMATLSKGSVVVIFTPDDTHFAIAREALARGLHVLVTKPAVKTLEHHAELSRLASSNGVLCAVEFHKRFDPIYADARDRIRARDQFGFPAYFSSYMSQPKTQLLTFSRWVGSGASDISYYLNSHHIDYHCSLMRGVARPVSVTGMASRGVATAPPFSLPPATEDTITLMVQWEGQGQEWSGHVATAVYTASWAAPKSDVHSQQRFHCMGTKAEVTIDQAHRGYFHSTDDGGLASVNPLFMKYTPGPGGVFAGEHGYGYRSFELFLSAATRINSGAAKPEDFEDSLATIHQTIVTTAILEAGRKSIDEGGRPIQLSF